MTLGTAAGGGSVKVDSTGNVGIGVTPETWNTNFTAARLGTRTVLANTTAGNGETTILANNFLNDGSAEQHLQTGPASIYQQYNGTHSFAVAPSASAGAATSLTYPMTIDNSGRVTTPYQPAASFTWNTHNFYGIFPANVITLNVGGHLSGAGRFTAPIAGAYLVSATYMTEGANNGHVYINKNGVAMGQGGGESYVNSATYARGKLFNIIQLAAGDYLEIYCASSSRIHQQYGTIVFRLMG